MVDKHTISKPGKQETKNSLEVKRTMLHKDKVSTQNLNGTWGTTIRNEMSGILGSEGEWDTEQLRVCNGR